MTEQWKPIPGWEGTYEVSNLGRVRSLDRWISNSFARFMHKGRLRKLQVGKRDGYHLVRLQKDAVGKTYTVHKLVMLAFVGPRPEGLEVCHYNGIRTDNRLENLRYGTPSENGHDSVRHGTNRGVKITHCPKGHQYTPDNTYVNIRRSGPKAGNSFRTCRRCAIDRADQWKADQRMSNKRELI